MLLLSDNIYNRRLTRDEPKFKLWRSAGLILTYECSSACRFCYYNCSARPSPVMPIETAISSWQSLKVLAGNEASVHLTGGEVFLVWPHLEAVMRAAKKERLGLIEQVETNASWAVEPKVIRERMRFLDEYGMGILKISCDPFHQEFVPIERVRLLASVAEEVLGRNRVLVRWEKYLTKEYQTDLITNKPELTLNRFKECLKDDPCRFTGRAAEELAELVSDKTAADLAAKKCEKSFLIAKGVHIDPLGNVFSGTCSGIIAGNLNTTNLEQIWRQFDWRNHEFIDILFHGGPVAMLEKAINFGYKERRYYASGCHLCTSIREFCFGKGLFKSVIGPGYCYASGKVKTE